MAIAARIVGDANEAAIRAALEMTAKAGSAACFDRTHDAALGPAEVAVVRLAKRFAVAAEDVCHLQ
jgi:hypothetical protein